MRLLDALIIIQYNTVITTNMPQIIHYKQKNNKVQASCTAVCTSKHQLREGYFLPPATAGVLLLGALLIATKWNCSCGSEARKEDHSLIASDGDIPPTPALAAVVVAVCMGVVVLVPVPTGLLAPLSPAGAMKGHPAPSVTTTTSVVSPNTLNAV